MAFLELASVNAAILNAVAAALGIRLVFLFNTFPPDIFVPGQRPSQEANVLK